MYQPPLVRRGEKGGLLAKYETDTQIFVGVQVELTSVFFQTPPFIIIRGILAQVCFSLLAACKLLYSISKYTSYEFFSP